MAEVRHGPSRDLLLLVDILLVGVLILVSRALPFIFVYNGEGPRIDQALINDLGAPIVRRVWNRKSHRILLEQLLNVAHCSHDLVLEQAATDLA